MTPAESAYIEGVKLAFAESTELEKRALLEMLAEKALPWLAEHAPGMARGAWNVAKGVGKNLAGDAMSLGRGLMGAPVEAAANLASRNVANPTAMQRGMSTAWSGAKALWRNPLAKESLMGGAANGTLAAATAQPGDRMNAFGRGFGWGAAGGAAFRGGHLLSNEINPMVKSLSPTGMLGKMGKGMLNMGTKGFALGTAAGMAMPSGMENPHPEIRVPLPPAAAGYGTYNPYGY